MNPRIKQMLTRMAIENPGVQGRFKLAAGIVFRRHLIATGVNSYNTHPWMNEWGTNSDSIFLHAEIDAIKNSLKLINQSQLERCSMYIVRVKRLSATDRYRWTYGLAKPCDGCMRAITNFNLKQVLWTDDESKELDKQFL